MRKLRGILFLILMGCSLTMCKKENLCDCTKSTGDMVKEIRSLGEFNSLNVYKNVVVTLFQDSVNYAEVEAGSHLIDLVKTNIEDGILKITNTNTCNWVRSYDKEIHVRLHLKKLNTINHYGAKEIRCANRLVTDRMDVYQYNSADIHLNIEATQVGALQMVGGGDIYLDGEARFNYNFGGSFGYIYARTFISDSVLVDHRGTGNIYVSPKIWFKVNIEDRGNVYYSGEPELIAYLNGNGQLYHE